MYKSIVRVTVMCKYARIKYTISTVWSQKRIESGSRRREEMGRYTEHGRRKVAAAAMSADAAGKQRRKAAARDMKKRNLQSATEARAATEFEEDVVGEAPAEGDCHILLRACPPPPPQTHV